MAIAVDIGQMLINLSQSYEPVMRMLTGGAYVMGFAFCIAGIMSLKQFGESRSMMSSSAHIKTPIIYFLIGSVFLYLPEAIDTFVYTAFQATTSPIAYTPPSSSGIPANVVNSVLRLVQIIGLIAFLRGWFILAHLAKSGGQPQIGKALTHIIGGIFAINIVGTMDILSATFGLSWT